MKIRTRQEEQQLESYISYLAHMLDESAAVNEEAEEQKGSDDASKAKGNVKDPKQKIEDGLKGMRPGAAMQAVAKSLGMSSGELLSKHLLKIVINAVKNGKVKASALKDAIKGFGDKNVEDNSKIDWEHVELDPSGTFMKALFDGDAGRRLEELAKAIEKGMEGVKKEIEEGDKKLHDDAKKAGVKLSNEEIDENGLAVASVIDSKEAKGKDGKELTKDVKAAIEQDKAVKEIVQKAEAAEKKLDSIKVSSKLSKLSDAELEKRLKELEAEMKKRKGKLPESLLAEASDQSFEDILNSIGSEEDAHDAVKKLVKAGKSAEEAQEEVLSKVKNADWYKSLDGDAEGEFREVLDLEASAAKSGTTTISDVTDLDAAGIPAGHSDSFGKVPTGFAVMPDGSKVPSFSYQSMSKQISDLDDIFDDGKVTPEEMAKLNGMASKLDSYTRWAAENKGSDDPAVQTKIAAIKRLTAKYNSLVDENASSLESSTEYFNGEQGAARLSLPKGADGKAVAAAAKSEEAQKAAGGWKKALGLDKAFTALGVARLAAKMTGVVLNNGKAAVDLLGAQALKFKEDNGVIARMDCLLTNGEGSKSKFEDTKFSVRFDVNDCKWHATCLDNRKMKFPEDKLTDVVLKSDVGKKFKAFCLEKWRSVFRPKDEKKSMLPFILANADKIGLKVSGVDKKLLELLKKMNKQFSKIEAAMK